MRWLFSLGLIMCVCGIAAGQSPPSNNDCVDAQEIYLGTTAFSTVDATTDGDAHSECQNEGQTYNDIWYTFTSGASGTLVISTCSIVDYDSDLVAYYGDNCSNLEFAGCNDDGDDCFEFSSYLEVPVLLGDRMTIRVGGWQSGDEGSGDIFLDIIDAKGNSIASPANDDCAEAVEIGEGDYYFTTLDATTDGPAHPECEVDGDGGQTGNDVWYRYIAPTSGTLTLSTCDQANYDTDLVIYNGTDCNNLLLVGCNDDGWGCNEYSSHLVVKVIGGTEYLIRVGGYSVSDIDEGTGLLSVSIVGDTVTWVGADGGSWFDASNWSSGVVPTASVHVTIDGSVSLDQSGAVAASVTVQSGGNLIMEYAISSLTTDILTVDVGGNLNWKGGTIDVSYGNLDINQSLSIGCLFEGTLIAESTLILADDITICAQGTMITTSWVTADFISNMGTLSFINSYSSSNIGYMLLNGDYEQLGTGTLIIDIDSTGTGGTDFDYLAVGGTSTLDGTIELRSHDGFQPVHGDSFEVLFNNSGANSGSFATIEVTGFSGGVNFNQDSSVGGCTMTATITPIIYVDGDNSSGDGTSWGSAFPTLQQALSVASFGDQIWVAEGIYTPGSNRWDAFVMEYSVSVCGGFDGTETHINQRDIATHPTILSGDVNNTEEDDTDNSYHVVVSPAGYLSSLDGLTITKGYANGGGAFSEGGGVMQNYGSMNLTNCTLIDNYASETGGGMHVTGGATSISQCVIDGNKSVAGGGVYSLNGQVSIGQTTFVNNRANTFDVVVNVYGGGLYIDGGSLDITDSLFDANSAFYGYGIADGGIGGAIYATHCDTTISETSFTKNRALNGGAIYFNEISTSQIALINRCKFTNNYIYFHVTPYGVGAAAFEQDGFSQTMIVNSLFAGNVGEGEPIIDMGTQGGYVNRITNCTIAHNQDVGTNAAVTGSMKIENSIVWYNEGTYGRSVYNQINGPILIDTCLVDHIDEGGAITNNDPFFRSARGADGVYGTGDEDYRLLPGSIAIDWGDDGLFNYPVANVPHVDLDGNNRFVNDPYSYDWEPPSTIDLGCYEYQEQVIGVSGFRTWIYPGSTFDNDQSWNPSETPGISDTAVIPRQLGAIQFNNNESIKKLIVSSGVADFYLNGYTLSIVDNDETLMIGHQEDAAHSYMEFGIVNGTVVADSVDVSGACAVNDTSQTIGGRIYFGEGTIQSSNGVVLRNNTAIYGLGTIQGDLFSSGSHQIDSVNHRFPSVTGDYFMTENSIEGLDGTGDIVFQLWDWDGSGVLPHISVGGVTTLGGVLQLHGPSGSVLDVGESATILESTGGIVENFDSILAMGFSSDIVPIVSIVPGDGDSESVIVTIYSVSGLLGFGETDPTNLNSIPKDAVLADIDGDDLDDIVLSMPDEINGNGDTDDVIILFNGGVTGGVWNGFTGGSQQVIVGDKPGGLAVGDFDEDGDIDIAVANTNDDTISLLKNETTVRGQVTLTESIIAADYYTDDSVEVKPTDVAVGNFSDSGHIDLVIANKGDSMVVIVEGPLFSVGFMPNGNQFDAPGGSDGVNPGDVNNDKDLDVIHVMGSGGNASILKGNVGVTSSYGMPILIDMGDSLSEHLVADLDTNGKDDLIVADPDSNAISIALQNADGTYRTPAILQLDATLVGGYVSPQSIAVMDIDNDGDLDLAVVAQNDSNNMVTVLLRNDSPVGGGVVSFTDISQPQGEGLNPLMARASDIDNDGFDDLLMLTDTVAFRNGDAVGSTRTMLNDFVANPCPSDLDGNGDVGVDDLLILIGAWGDTSGPADINNDRIVDVNDMLELIGAWGSCPR